jgi:hypothetical protein
LEHKRFENVNKGCDTKSTDTAVSTTAAATTTTEK